ncbi:MAG: hypothetical protein HQL84_03680 [Magnetococcales bacterium]|nr:hypothetical protein [Magnetococcales bacterium]MBF0149127.1 hypothetical protein [Magnetococcales bacterium]MBF0173226.1 hypothetical protein [Magnetococcales bacterium]MBF0632700.1 hypothetical protein [Magnetococcales bacterium]
MNLGKIVLILMATMALGSFLFDSGRVDEVAPALYTLILLVLAGLVLFFLRNFLTGDEDKTHNESDEVLNRNANRGSSRPLRVIHHESTWAVVARGRSLGMFKNAPIHEWIRTSDQREADYSGISNAPLPEQCTCIEIPDRAELIVPPGLIYTIRS